jgi:uncharacterized membrane protein
MSFLTLGIFWQGRQAQLKLLERTIRDVICVHIVFLAWVCLLPFSTAWLAQFIAYRLARLAYWARAAANQLCAGAPHRPGSPCCSGAVLLTPGGP